jgi:5-formyltetrahydrofolate cyclo-ligase
MIKNAWKDGKITAAPVVNDKKITMCAAEFSSFKKSLRTGAYGILEPDLKKCVCILSKDIDLVLVPAVSFDACGHRIGYGKGYYDKWLKSFPKEKRVGLSFNFQVTDKLPFTKNDLKVSKVITEERIVSCK